MALALRGVDVWPEQGVTFETIRGSFVIEADALARAAVTGDDFEIRRAFARHLPDEAKPSRREKIRGGGLRVHWRIVRVVPAPMVRRW